MLNFEGTQFLSISPFLANFLANFDQFDIQERKSIFLYKIFQ